MDTYEGNDMPEGIVTPEEEFDTIPTSGLFTNIMTSAQKTTQYYVDLTAAYAESLAKKVEDKIRKLKGK